MSDSTEEQPHGPHPPAGGRRPTGPDPRPRRRGRPCRHDLGHPAAGHPAGRPGPGSRPASVATAPVTRASRGPNAGAIVLGVLCLVLAGLAIAQETSGFQVDWAVFGPGAIVGVGVLVLLLGVLGLARRQR